MDTESNLTKDSTERNAGLRTVYKEEPFSSEIPVLEGEGPSEDKGRGQ